MSASDTEAAEVLELRREYEKLEKTNKALNERVLELYALYNVSRTLSMSLQLDELFELTMSALGESLNLDQFCLMLFDEDTGDLAVRASHGLPGEIGERGLVCAKDGISWKVAETGETVQISDIESEEEFFYFRGSELNCGSYLGIPLKRKDGRLVGVLNLHKPERGGFKKHNVELFEAVAEQVSLAIDNALTFKHTRELSHRDELTNLYNRRYFFDRFDRELYRAERYKHPMSLLMVDVDHFKNYNDTYGHLRGDIALKRVARVLEKSLRKADMVARYGGEEFLVLLPETDREGAIMAGEKLREEIAAVNFNRDDTSLDNATLTITVGVATMPGDTRDGAELLDLADKALYFGKARGRNQVCASIPEKGTGD